MVDVWCLLCVVSRKSQNCVAVCFHRSRSLRVYVAARMLTHVVRSLTGTRVNRHHDYHHYYAFAPHLLMNVRGSFVRSAKRRKSLKTLGRRIDGRVKEVKNGQEMKIYLIKS